MERGGGPRAGDPVPASRRAFRTAGGDTPDLPEDVDRRRDAIPRPALRPRAAAQLTTGADATASADHDRRLRRTKDAAPRREIRAGVQSLSHARAAPQTRSAACALREGGHGLRR